MKTSNLLRQVFALVILVVHSCLCFGQDQAKAVDIQLHFSDKDSVKSVTATVHEKHNNEILDPVKNKDIHFYVKRTFGPFLFSKEGLVTDENGEATAQFPSDLPGDSAGEVTIIVKLENVDGYADTEVAKTLKWGVAVINNEVEGRSLWASGANAPISYLILISSLVLGAWSLIIFIVFKLIRISRM